MKIFGIGKVIERFIVSEVKKRYTLVERFLQTYLDEGRDRTALSVPADLPGRRTRPYRTVRSCRPTWTKDATGPHYTLEPSLPGLTNTYTRNPDRLPRPHGSPVKRL